MSTKTIREVLELVKAHSPHAADVRQAEEALAKLEAIERAAKGLCHRGETFGSIHEKHWAVFESIARDAP